MINNFIENVLLEKLSVNSIIATKDGITQSHFFRSDEPADIRSISKVLSCLGVYFAIKKGVFDLNSKVLPFFSNLKITNEKNLERLNNLTIEDLLTLRIGHTKGLLFRKDVARLPQNTNLLEYVFNYDIPCNPGEYFIYNNAATYILSAIIQQETKTNLSDWVNEYIFKQLNINEFKWENSSQGICLGASGLWLKNTDLHKISEVLLNNGYYNSIELIEQSWIKSMTTPHVLVGDLPEYVEKQDRSLNKFAYGYHIWLCGNGSVNYPKTHYFCDGADGQFLIVVPKENLAVTILSKQHDMSQIYPLINDFVK